MASFQWKRRFFPKTIHDEKKDVNIVPNLPEQPSYIKAAADKRLHIDRAVSPTIDNTTYVVAVLRDIGEVFQDIPYVKAIAGITLTLLRIQEEVKAVGEMTSELILMVKKRTIDLLQSLQELPPNSLHGLHGRLHQYHTLLHAIETSIQGRKQSMLARLTSRLEARKDIEKYMRELNDFDGRFTIATLTNISVQLETITQQSLIVHPPPGSDTLFQAAIPPQPHYFHGRGTELNSARTLLLDCEEPRIAILGGAGIGKTTLLTTLLRDSNIASAYPRRFFVSCDQVTSLLDLLNVMANVLRFAADRRGQSLRVNVLSFLSTSTERILLCLDNFEDTWDPPSTRASIEMFLRELHAITTLGIIITMRGIERPSGVRWTGPNLPPLEPLHNDQSMALYEEVSGVSDGRASKLLAQTGNVPLAIELLARQTKLEGLNSVIERWDKEGITLLDRRDGSDGRTTSLTASIDLSLRSPRISTIPHVYDAIRMLAVLPNGLPKTLVAELEAHFPIVMNLLIAFHALLRLSLCYQDSEGRFRLLAPIRQHIAATIPLNSASLVALRETFFNHVTNTRASDFDAVVPELTNIRFFIASADETWSESRIRACMDYLWWEDHFLGTQDVQLAQLAFSHATATALKVVCRLRISELMRSAFRYAEAEQCLLPVFHVETGDPITDGAIQLEMGRVRYVLEKYEGAETCLRRAVELFKPAPERQGPALVRLGGLLRSWGRLVEAETPLIQSLELVSRAGDVLMQGNAMLELAVVYQWTNRVAEAKSKLVLAIDCFRRCGCVRDEANALRFLGDVYYTLGRLEEAEKSYTSARELYVHIHYPRGEAGAVRDLGWMYSRVAGKSGPAETFLRNALGIYVRISLSFGQAYTQEDLGYLLLRQGRAHEAIMHLILAIAFYLRRLHRCRWGKVSLICEQIREAMDNRGKGDHNGGLITDDLLPVAVRKAPFFDQCSMGR